ncbi:osmotically inducible protein OsmC [Pandoraea horticolens]|uniref:Osmotically inducible protein OsmC n=1 Tax=Pandoraea horticolens TaxID=2508298 RepID=A0A5E4XXF5_9BURK|nr:OsmC family protein [Pandoraea horticolens]VVE40967.1 osmotically inducible protein OsmC [Pandoraea horticolens]
MSNLREYLLQKKGAVTSWRNKIRDDGSQPAQLSARVSAEGRTGVRRIRVRDFQIIFDSGPELAGHSLGPGSQEMQLGVLGTCLTHIFLTQAALQDVPLDAINVEVTAYIDHRAGQPGFENVPVYPVNVRYTAHIESPASREQIAALHEAVERTCPIYNFLINPQTIQGQIEHTRTAA